MSVHKNWLHEALKLAHLAMAQEEVPVGAVVISPELTIVGQGFNQKQHTANPIGHAEVFAIQDAAKKRGDWRLPGHILVTTLEPCPMCLALSDQVRISKIVYGAKEPKMGGISLNYPVQSQIELIYEEVKECSDLMSIFFSKKRAK